MAILAPAPALDKPAIIPDQAPVLRQYHISYAVQDACSLEWAPFNVRIETDGTFLEAVNGLVASHYYRPLQVIEVTWHQVAIEQ